MSFDVLGDLNWLAVIVAAIAYFAIGAVWYAPPVLGKTWMAAGGITVEQTEGGPGGGGLRRAARRQPALGDRARHARGGDGNRHAGRGLVLGAVIAVGFALAISFVTATFESTKPKPMVWGAVNAGYHIVGNLVAAAIIGAWQ